MNSKKGQTLADFVVECSLTELDLQDRSEGETCLVTEVQPTQSSWTPYMDGSLTSDISGVGVN